MNFFEYELLIYSNPDWDKSELDDNISRKLIEAMCDMHLLDMGFGAPLQLTPNPTDPDLDGWAVSSETMQPMKNKIMSFDPFDVDNETPIEALKDLAAMFPELYFDAYVDSYEDGFPYCRRIVFHGRNVQELTAKVEVNYPPVNWAALEKE